MKFFSSRAKVQKISASSIEELLPKDGYHYSWNMSETKMVLAKCTTVLHVARLYDLAFDYFFRDSIAMTKERKAILDLLYKETLLKFDEFVQWPKEISFETVEQIMELTSEFGTHWKDIPNPPGRKMLKTRSENLWMEECKKLFALLQTDSKTTAESYIRLIDLCREDDPLRFEIATVYNKIALRA